jgi:DNA-binding LacI/PurR family transcriptional regulator
MRKAAKQSRVVAKLREEILDGKFGETGRLPTLHQLARRFRVSYLTAQRSVKLLVEEELVETHPRRGTSPNARPPHHARYALVFPHDPADTASLWSRFYSTLVNETRRVEKNLGVRFDSFYGLDKGRQSQDYARLLESVQTRRVAGIIFTSSPHHLIGTPLLDQPGIPRVAMMGGMLFSNVPTVSFQRDFFRRALRYLAGRDCARVALLVQFDQIAPEVFSRLVVDAGLTTKPSWIVPMTPHLVAGARTYVQLLLAVSREERPDALIIADDNYVEPAIEGIKLTGVKVPSELEIVAHTNFPWAGASPLPVARLGYEAAEALRACVRLIDRQRAGETVPALTVLPAKFEEELTTAGGLPQGQPMPASSQ